MNPTIIRIDLARLWREPAVPIFTIGLPALLYIIFGGSASYGSEPIGNGNISMVMLVNMALYGAMTATVTVSSSAATEKMQGWGRQLALSGQSDAQYIASKTVVGLLMATLTVSVMYMIGFAMGAEAPATAWALSFILVILGSAMMSLFGLLAGLALRGDVAISVSTGLLVLFAFIGSLFTPLSDTLYRIAQFTPVFGIGAIARYPVAQGQMWATDGLRSESLTIAIINAVVWALIFAAGCLVAMRYSRRR